MPLDSSTVITPSVPTLSNASDINSPIVASLFADMVATCLILSLSVPIVIA